MNPSLGLGNGILPLTPLREAGEDTRPQAIDGLACTGKAAPAFGQEPAAAAEASAASDLALSPPMKITRSSAL